MEINNIGANAGILWNTLNENGKMTTTVETRCGKDCEYITL